MSIESWFVLTVAAAFLLLGIAGSPLAWVALHHRKSQLEKMMDERLANSMPSCAGSRAGSRWLKQPATRPKLTENSFRLKTDPMAAAIPTGRSSRAGDEPATLAPCRKTMTRP